MLYQSALGGSWYEVCQDYALSRSLTWPRERKRLTGGFTLCNAAFQLSGTGTYSAGFWTWKGCSVLFCYNDLNFILCKYDLLFTLNTFCHCILNVFGIVCSYTIYIYIYTYIHTHICTYFTHVIASHQHAPAVVQCSFLPHYTIHYCIMLHLC